MNYGLINRWLRLFFLLCVVLIEILILSLDPDPETSPSMHVGGLVTGLSISLLQSRDDGDPSLRCALRRGSLQ